MFCIQALDHEEGTGARWFEIKNKAGRYPTKEAARDRLRVIRAEDEDRECLYSYRIVEVGSPTYYQQPTDVLEW